MTKREQFYEQVVENISAQLGEEVIVKIDKVNKVNCVLDALIIHREDETSAPVIYLDPFFEKFEAGDSIENVLEDILAVYTAGTCTNIAALFQLDEFKDFDTVKDRIILKVINTERNQNLLRSVPSVPVGELGLSAVFYITLLTGEMNAVILVKNDFLATWNKDVSDLVSQAEENANKFLNFSIRDLGQVLSELMDLSENDVLNAPALYILTDETSTLGASQLYFKDKIREFALQYECDVYILPSSIHELLLLPVSCTDMDVESLREMVISVNATAVSDMDFLYDGVFKYILAEDRIVEA